MTRFVVAGDSHVPIYLKGVREAGRPDLLRGGSIGAASLYARPFFVVEAGDVAFIDERIQGNYESWQAVTGAPLSEHKGKLLLSIGLSSTIFWADRFWASASDRSSEKKRYISDAVIEATVASMQENAIRFYQFCLDGGLLVGAIASPPPQRRAPAVRHTGADSLFRLRTAFEQPLRSFLHDKGIPVIEMQGMSDPDGFLKAEYAGTDPHHASPACGPRLVEAIETTFGR